jgi:hypothetical protein
METRSSTPEQPFWDALRRRRAELRESMSALEHALAAPALGGGAGWAQRVQAAMVELSADFREHVRITEGPDGLYRELLKRSPRLSEAVARLTREHAQINDRIENLLALVTTSAEPQAGQGPGHDSGHDSGHDDSVDRVRTLGTALLGRLVRHRQRGSDLVYEAYDVDIGGET